MNTKGEDYQETSPLFEVMAKNVEKALKNIRSGP